jgi:hypothetical protein
VVDQCQRDCGDWQPIGAVMSHDGAARDHGSVLTMAAWRCLETGHQVESHSDWRLDHITSKLAWK